MVSTRPVGVTDQFRGDRGLATHDGSGEERGAPEQRVRRELNCRTERRQSEPDTSTRHAVSVDVQPGTGVCAGASKRLLDGGRCALRGDTGGGPVPGSLATSHATSRAQQESAVHGALRAVIITARRCGHGARTKHHRVSCFQRRHERADDHKQKRRVGRRERKRRCGCWCGWRGQWCGGGSDSIVAVQRGNALRACC